MHVLVIRLSAMGDVAMTVPVIVEALEQNPELSITVLSRSPFQDFFPLSNRLRFKAMDTKGKHKGFLGIRKVFKELKSENNFTAVADFHNVLRSKVLSQFFSLAGIPFAAIDKGRDEKKELTKKEGKDFRQLKHSTLRYVEVFKKLGLQVDFDPTKRKQFLSIEENPPLAIKKINIGIAPFAQHLGKSYPFFKIKQLIKDIAKNKDVAVFLFGGGPQETELLKQQETENVFSLAGKFSMKQELAQMQSLQVMVSMDSANMHLAALLGVKVISIWGATHYFAGFLGVGQSIKDVVEIPVQELSCRPCSVFGNKPCFRKDYACLQRINPKVILDKINASINH